MEKNVEYWVPAPLHRAYADSRNPYIAENVKLHRERGLIHLSEENAKTHGMALASFFESQE